MVTSVEVDVTVKNVTWDEAGYYVGQFKYKQKSPSNPKIVGPTGNIDATSVTDALEIAFNWKSKKVKIDGTEYGTSLLSPVNDSVLVDKTIVEKPTTPAPPSGSVITVNPGPGSDDLKLSDSNDDGGAYSYALVVHVDKDGGQRLIDDPIIINRQPGMRA